MLTHSLETSTSFSSSSGGGGYDDTEVRHFEDVLHLSNQMIILAREFLGKEVCGAQEFVPSSGDDTDDGTGDDDGYGGGDTGSGSTDDDCPTVLSAIRTVLRTILCRIHTTATTEMGNAP